MADTKSHISNVLVANRGEIAMRIMQTARSKGKKTVAVYTDADADAPHVLFADQAIRIGAGPVADSYLDGAKILAAAAQTGADAIHPGYGFLSENADFAAACSTAGLVFIGPSPDAIRVMGNKAAAKRKMLSAGVPCVPGYNDADQSDDAFKNAALQVGYPVMIKAAAGGGGRGMRLVDKADGLLAGLALARSEAMGAFGSDELILEKAIINPRHVEIQIFADRTGHTVHLGERDCSVQRRHQKVVEESPCPVMTPELRAKMGIAAVAAARAVNYEGAGTVEFLLDAEGSFYFLEMNTRLQVEHPVTELVTGRDLVALQLSVAEGAPLGFDQGDVSLKGHAIEVRLYAEDPENGFLPASGNIKVWDPDPALRVDAGITSGGIVSPYYDPMLAKLIAHGETRSDARHSLIEGLKNTALFGVPNNRDFLIDVLQNQTFADGGATTGFIAQEFRASRLAPESVPVDVLALAGALMHQHGQFVATSKAVNVSSELLGWSSTGTLKSRLRISHAGQVFGMVIHQKQSGTITILDTDMESVVVLSDHQPRVNGVRQDLRHHQFIGDCLHLCVGTRSYTFTHMKSAAFQTQNNEGGTIKAPMHGNLLSVSARVGDHVEKGMSLAVLEAMKMQHELLTEVNGTIKAVNRADGDQVKAGDVLIEIELAKPDT